MLPKRRRAARLTGCRLVLLAISATAALSPSGTAVADPLAKAAPAAERAQQSTRFVIGLERATEFQVSSLANPPRVIVDLPEVKVQLPLVPGDRPVGLVRSFRAGEAAPGKSKVVIEATAPVMVERAVVEKSPDGRSIRLVLDIVASVPATTIPAAAQSPQPQAKAMRAGAFALGATGIQPPAPRRAVRPGTQAENIYRPLIVLDPGHGGHDTGAQKYGTVEKDVVLAFGKMLRDKLVASNRYRVLMTRDNDSFVELDDRRAFAEHNKAALFIAIHADYASTRASGATIYSLRESVAESLKRSARGSLRDRIMAGRELAPIKSETSGDASAVKGFLADLAQREVDANKDRTVVFAQSVIESMGQSTSLRDNPDRSAAFRVLKTAQLPAVLIELAYVSNQEDARNLRSEEWRRKVTESIMTAIDNYFSHKSAQVPM